MIIDGGVRSTEYDLRHKIVSQEIMRKAQFDFRGFVQLGDLFASQLPVKTLQVVLNLRGAASTDNRDDGSRRWRSQLSATCEAGRPISSASFTTVSPIRSFRSSGGLVSPL